MTKWGKKLKHLSKKTVNITNIYSASKIVKEKVHKFYNNFRELRTEFTVKELQIAPNDMKKIFSHTCDKKECKLKSH